MNRRTDWGFVFVAVSCIVGGILVGVLACFMAAAIGGIR